MKKALCVLLSFIMCFSMTACVGDQANNGSEFLNAVFTDATEAPFVEVPFRIVRWDRSALNEEGVSSNNYYYDYVELQGDSPAYQKINAALYSHAEKLMNHYSSGEEIKEWGYGSGYAYARTEVTHNQDGFFCVEIKSDQYLGGNTSQPYFYNFCFNVNTGEEATLAELTGIDEKDLLPQIRKIAWEGLLEQHGSMLDEGVDERINSMELTDFKYFVKEGQILLHFERYSVTNGAAGESWIPTGFYLSSSAVQDKEEALAPKDSDNDGYTDDVDLNPNEPYKVPIILLHGRISNTAVFFGVRTGIERGDNDYYGTEYDSMYMRPDNHEIIGIDEGRLGAYIQDTLEYKANKNLFAFNYPNQDMVALNAIRLQFYIENLVAAASKNASDSANFVDAKYLFATKSDQKEGRVKFILIGHSLGGLVSRYYIENINDQYVEKLITICTPHYGSGLANVARFTDGSVLPDEAFVPCDVDLAPNSLLYGGDKQRYDYTKNKEKQEELKYGCTNQSKALKGNHNTDVKYYAVCGYDVEAENKTDLGEKQKQFLLAPKLYDYLKDGGSVSVVFDRDVTSLQACRDSVNAALEAVSKDRFKGSSELGLSVSGGDDVVNWTSQIAVRFGDAFSSQKLAGTALILATGHNGLFLNYFHNLIADATAMHEAVGSFINCQDEPWYDVDDWTMVDAHYDERQEHIVLTKDFKTWQCGSIWHNDPIAGDFVFEMDYYTGSTDRSYDGADGIVVAFYADSDYKKPSGLDIGFSGCKGYGIELDTYYNSERGDPKEYNHIGLVKGTVGEHIVFNRLPQAEDERWHHLKIDVSEGVCTAYVDGELKLTHEVEETGYQRFGITSATGRGHNFHAVKNIYLAEKTE